MDLRVDDENLRTLLSKSIMDALTPETREKLIGDAVKAILNPSPYSKKSTLEDAFNSAVDRVAREFALKELAENAAFKTKIESLFADVSAKLFSDGEQREKLVDNIARMIRNSLDR